MKQESEWRLRLQCYGFLKVEWKNTESAVRTAEGALPSFQKHLWSKSAFFYVAIPVAIVSIFD